MFRRVIGTFRKTHVVGKYLHRNVILTESIISIRRMAIVNRKVKEPLFLLDSADNLGPGSTYIIQVAITLTISSSTARPNTFRYTKASIQIPKRDSIHPGQDITIFQNPVHLKKSYYAMKTRV